MARISKNLRQWWTRYFREFTRGLDVSTELAEYLIRTGRNPQLAARLEAIESSQAVKSVRERQ